MPRLIDLVWTMSWGMGQTTVPGHGTYIMYKRSRIGIRSGRVIEIEVMWGRLT
jgi:hypothetical protein